MTWWARSHRILWSMGISAGSAVLAFLLDSIDLVVPSFGSSSPFAQVPLYAVLPVAIPIALAGFLSAGSPPGYNASTRPVFLMDWLTHLAALTVATFVATLLGTVGWVNGPQFIRTSIALVGIQMLFLPALRYRYQAVAPVLYLFFAAIVGRSPSGATQEWAWALTPTSADWHFAASGVALVAGSVSTLLCGRRAFAPGTPD